MASSKPTVININTTIGRATDVNFTELVPKTNVGPVPVLPPNTSLETNVIPTAKPAIVATWAVMDKFDTGLKNAIIDFTDTTKEGVKAGYTPQGRTKILEFNFYGTGTKSIMPDEIGDFTLTFSYPPGANNATSTVSPNSISTNISTTPTA